MRVPPGGRMGGIPRCGGAHHVKSENLCYDCQYLKLQTQLIEVQSKHVSLLEEQLILQTGLPPSGQRVKVKAPAPTPPPQQNKETNLKGGMDVQPRRSRTSE